MGLITQTQINNGDNLDATVVNNDFTSLFNEFNGNIDNNNIKPTANIDGSKILAASIPAAQIKAEAWGSWTPSFGGFSVSPTVTFSNYTQLGKTVLFEMDLSGGTSNATTFTITLPVAAKRAVSILCSVVDAGSSKTTPGRIVTTAGSTSASVFSDAGIGTWTASGAKNLYIGNGVYEAN